MKESINTILDQDAKLPPFSFHLCVCFYRFLQERSQMIPTQEQQRLVEKAIKLLKLINIFTSSDDL